MIINRLVGFLSSTAATVLWVVHQPVEQYAQAIAPVIIAAIIGGLATAAAAGASAGQSAASADAANAQNKANLAMQEEIAKKRRAQEMTQAYKSSLAQGNQMVAAAIQGKADVALNRAAERQKTRANLASAMSRLIEEQ